MDDRVALYLTREEIEVLYNFLDANMTVKGFTNMAKVIAIQDAFLEAMS